ncbi:MAG: hypothetical protein SGBAC_013105 [Bacillariaceae sp.]
MPTALDLFMSGMISNKSKQFGVSVDCVLVVDNAVLDFETFNDDECGPATQCQQAALRNNDIDVSEDHIRTLRWSASMGDRKALAGLSAVEEHRAKRDTIEYENKLRWCATMGDTASLLKLNQMVSRMCTGTGTKTCALQTKLDATDKKAIVHQTIEEANSRRSGIVQKELGATEEKAIVQASKDFFEMKAEDLYHHNASNMNNNE